MGEILTIKVLQLDSLFWKPDWVGVSKEEQRQVQSELIKNEEMY